jgi:predicted alpha/beta-fold hydrolase
VNIRFPLPASAAPADFRPLPFLGNPHVQTLLGHWLPGPPVEKRTREHVLRLPDGDGLVLHDNVPRGWRPGEPVAVVVHGLTGSHSSSMVRRVARQILARGVRAVRLDLRGAGKALPLCRRCYHGGCSDDIRAALEQVHAWSPASPLLLMGVSLGGNIALKLAGEAADDPVPSLARVAALGPPIDLARCSVLLARPQNRIYEVQFVRELSADARWRQRYFPDLPPLRFPQRLTMRLFDELYTAPRGGFADAQDYYSRASSFPLIGRITVRTLILTARDDPFIAVAPFEELAPPPGVEVQILPRGGHLGFLGWDGAGGIRWAERRAVDWLLA